MTNERMKLAVAGLHLTDQPLNHQLLSLGATLERTCNTAPYYKMFLITDDKGHKPGLIRLPAPGNGFSYEVEVWSLPVTNLGSLLANIPQPLGLGTLTLEDGSLVKGFICEYCVAFDGKDISSFKGWKDYLKTLK